MSKIVFDGKGFKAEKLCAKQFRGETVSSKHLQYKDIDCYVNTLRGVKYSASVKDQTYSTKKGYDTIQIELEQTNTRNNKTILGCFLKNESDYYFWLVWYEGKTQWIIIKSDVLKEYVNTHKETLKTWTTSHYTEAKNRQYNRTYDRSSGVMIKISDIAKLGEVKELKV